jgi:DNA polymerase, archaea type
VPRPALEHVLYGCDAAPAIVSVDAGTNGRARIWQRDGQSVRLTERRFANWFLTTSLDLLAHLPAAQLPADAVRTAHGQLEVRDGLAVVVLDSPRSADPSVYRYLVLTTCLAEVETALVETANKRDGGEAQTFEDLRGLVLACHPIEQFLILSGCTYFKGMQYADLHRLQFDLETTGLNDERDRIFMISVRDSQGWEQSLDARELGERNLITRFIELVRSRDPDVLENHNIFAFDLPFLVHRAARLGLPLTLGRDGSAPRLESDVFDVGERPEPFLRWRISGREIVDTQHAVRQYGAVAPELRRHGLKEAARYFGLAREDREYVPGAEIWATYQTDPERVRRYAAGDVDEVDGLSRRLLPTAFELASLVPRAYERIAADGGPTALWEPLMVRAYLHEGRAIPGPLTRLQRPASGLRPELGMKGVVAHAARADMRPLLPRVLATASLHAANDELALQPWLVEALLEMDTSGARALAEAAPRQLAGQGLFSDPQAASDVAGAARQYVDRVMADLRTRGCVAIESDTEQVLFATPPDWSETIRDDLSAVAAAYLPDGVQLTFPDHYRAVYARAPGSFILLGQDASVTFIGSAFRPGRLERFGETFMHRAAPLALTGDVVGLRRLFLDTVHRLRRAELPLEDLCVQVTLHKSPPQYKRGGTHEEPYEVLLAAGVRSWRIGQRIRYFRGRGAEPRLLREGGGMSSAEADADYYVQRLYGLYAQQFAQAFRREDFSRIFAIPAGDGPFSVEPFELAGIRPIATPA